METERPAKRAKLLLDDSDSEADNDPQDSVAESSINRNHSASFKVNEEFARRFEHNKKREEMQKLEEKYRKPSGPSNRRAGHNIDENEAIDSSDSSSDSEDEDDEGLLATEALDGEISATLQAIRSKDPRVYDEKATFYSEFDDQDGGLVQGKEKEKPMFLKDYHRINLLKGEDFNGTDPPRTYAQEQGELRSNIIQEMQAVANDTGRESLSANGDGAEEDGEFLLRKTKTAVDGESDEVLRASNSNPRIDPTLADKDPDNFLSNFMSARAWVPTPNSRFQPFESDDEEEDKRAEAFESAYNLRFEDPQGANEKLVSHARDAAAKYSVRREEPKSRKKARDTQRQRKEEEKQIREEEKARLKRLKMEEIQYKVQTIKEAAGLRGKKLKEEDWAKFLEDGWDDERWEKEMNRTFGDSYYAEGEVSADDDGNDATDHKKRKIKKPKWKDDIQIDDLVPDFQDDRENEKPQFTLEDNDEKEHEIANALENASEPEDDGSQEDLSTAPVTKNSNINKAHRQARNAQRNEARNERKKIEQLVNDNFSLSNSLPASLSNKPTTTFRYRATSPTSYGLTAHDILEAEDRQLNQYVGLKKMAAFRDPEKKKRDKKKLGKKARLREWRKETFGHEDGPRVRPQDIPVSHSGKGEGYVLSDGENGVVACEGKRKKKRSRRGKNAHTSISTAT